MRMHTIPQNVSAYEDRIVGSLVGKQFIFLAIGGVITVALLTTSFAPAFIRVPAALVVVLFCVALALIRINDRPFDEIFLGYVRAVLGPTEWTWGKETAVPPQLEKMLVVGDDLTVGPKTTSLKDSQAQKRRQAQHYQKLLSHQRRTGLDESEIQFIDQLDFSLSVPQKVFTTTKDSSSAPPMLTRDNYQQGRTSSTTEVVKKNFTVQGSLTPLAGVGTNRLTYIAADNTVTLAKDHIQPQTNRSLSRHALAHANLTMPIKGEIQLNLTADTQQSLNQIIAQQHHNNQASLAQVNPTQPSQPSPQHDINNQTPALNMNQSPDPQQSLTNPSDNQPQGEYEATFGTADRQYFPVTQQPSAPAADVTPTAAAPSSVSYPTAAPRSADNVTQSELNSIESALTDLQQSSPQDATDIAAISSQGKFDKFASQTASTLPIPDPNLASLPVNQPVNNASDHSSYTPLPVNPVLNPTATTPQPATPTLDQSPVSSLPSPSPAGEPQPPASNLQPPTATAAVDNQAVKVVAQAPTLASKQVVLTQEPNIISGRVIDAQDQSVPGVVIVVKNEQGEAKRALKTNKLGQFVVTTPLSNGTYTVEVDKKGFNFDIIQVQLTGMVLPAIEIHAK